MFHPLLLNYLPQVSKVAKYLGHKIAVNLQMFSGDMYVLIECLTTKEFNYRQLTINPAVLSLLDLQLHLC